MKDVCIKNYLIFHFIPHEWFICYHAYLYSFQTSEHKWVVHDHEKKPRQRPHNTVLLPKISIKSDKHTPRTTLFYCNQEGGCIPWMCNKTTEALLMASIKHFTTFHLQYAEKTCGDIIIALWFQDKVMNNQNNKIIYMRNIGKVLHYLSDQK